MSTENQNDMQLDDILEEIRRKRDLEDSSRRERQYGQTGDLDLSSVLAASLLGDEEDAVPEPQEAPPDTQKIPTKETTVEIYPEKKEREPAAGAREGTNIRSLKTAFSGDEDDTSETHINKRMLAPTLGPEETDSIDTEEIEVPEIFQESNDLAAKESAAYEKHPLFTSSHTQQILLPEQENEADKKPSANESGSPIKAIKGKIIERTEEIRRKGVLNVKENIDDEEFKTFFSNTVVIDSKPLAQRSLKQKRITDFVVGEDGGPVFEESAVEKDGSLSEYRSDDETEQVMSFLGKRDRNLLARVFISGLAASLLLLYNLLSRFEILQTATGNDTTAAVVNAALMLIAIAANYRSVFRGFAKLIRFRADADSATSAAALVGVLEPVLAAALGSDARVFFTPVAAAALFFSVLGKRISAKRVLSGFAAVSADYEKYAAVLLDDDAFSKRLTRGLSGEGARVLIKRKTGFSDDFLAHSKSRDGINSAVSLPVSILFFLTIACGIAIYFRTRDIFPAVQAVGLAAVLITPFTATLTSALPIDSMQKTLARIGCVVPGFSAADAVVGSNCVVLEGRELFPRGNVLLHGIKTFDRERIDRAILYAASVLIQSCDTMSHMFLNVIQNKTEMLYDVDNIIFEDGLGFSCWVDKTRILIGTRELLESRDIDVPSRDYENRYTKSSSRDAIYLAVSGKLYAMFVVSYAPGAEVERAMRGFDREGIGVLVRTRDFNITAEKISRIYKVPRAMISIVEDHDMEELAKKTAYTNRTPSLFTHIGSLSSYVGGILSCYRLQGTLKLTTTIELAAMIIGGLLALLLTVFDTLTFDVFSVLLFQLLWLVITVAATILRKYA